MWKKTTHRNKPHVAALRSPHQVPESEPENPSTAPLVLQPPVNSLHGSHRHGQHNPHSENRLVREPRKRRLHNLGKKICPRREILTDPTKHPRALSEHSRRMGVVFDALRCILLARVQQRCVLAGRGHLGDVGPEVAEYAAAGEEGMAE